LDVSAGGAGNSASHADYWGVEALLAALGRQPAAFWIVVSLALVLAGVNAHLYRKVPLSRRDARRRFSSAEWRFIVARAGGRCEHHGLFGRCRETSALQGDHVIPWAAGGRTDLSNGQALCARHNRAKGARVPTRRQLRKIGDRRGGESGLAE